MYRRVDKLLKYYLFKDFIYIILYRFSIMIWLSSKNCINGKKKEKKKRNHVVHVCYAHKFVYVHEWYRIKFRLRISIKCEYMRNKTCQTVDRE